MKTIEDKGSERFCRKDLTLPVRYCYDQIIETYIFNIESKDDKLQTELNAGRVSIELRGFFKENKYPLSENVKVEQIGEKYWRIKDKGRVYYIYGSFQRLNICIENDPPHPYHYMRRAVWYGRDIPDRAIGDISRAIELDPDRGEYYRYRGNLLLEKLWKDRDRVFYNVDEKLIYEKVITDYKIATEKNPTDTETWLDLIELNILLHNWDDAISICGSSRLFIDTKENQLIRSWLGCLALALAGDPIEEEDKNPLYDQTIRLESTSTMLRIISTSFIHEIEMKEEYKEKWKKAIEICKLFNEHLDDWEDRGDILERLRCYKEAVEAYNIAIGLKPDLAGLIYKKKGDILNKFLKHYEEAIQAYDKAIELYGKDYHIWYEKAKLLTILERYEEALNAFNKVEELNSGFFSYCNLWIRQGILLEKLNRYEEALQLYDKTISREKEWKAWHYKGLLLKKLNRYEESLEAFDKAIELHPEHTTYTSDYVKPWSWYEKACVYSLKNDKENALVNLSNAIKSETIYKDMAKNDDDFKNLWDDEDFKRIVG